MSFGPLTGDSKAIKEDQSISLLHILALGFAAAPTRRIHWLLKRRKFCVYALAWMSLARASTLVFLSTLN